MNERPVHLRFLGASVYCSVKGSRVKLGEDHRYGDAYTCPGCGHQEPATIIRPERYAEMPAVMQDNQL